MMTGGYPGLPGLDTQYYVCNYGPAGNYFGQEVYRGGQTCANCPATQCELGPGAGLCTQVSQGIQDTNINNNNNNNNIINNNNNNNNNNNITILIIICYCQSDNCLWCVAVLPLCQCPHIRVRPPQCQGLPR